MSHDILDPKLLELLKTKQYSEGISIITCTGDRAECLKRCAFYIERQTYNGTLEWIIADDGLAPMNPRSLSIHLDIRHLVRKNIQDRVKSFLGNLREAISNVRYNKVIIMEDDDWYHPEYLQLYWSRLINYDVIGEAPAKYYNVQHKCYRAWGNNDRASFCQTALKAKVLPTLYICTAHHSPFVDYRLWMKTSIKKFIFEDACHCIGIKGMPGRKGIGAGHRPSPRYKRDPEFKQLEKWIGKADTEFYRNVRF